MKNNEAAFVLSEYIRLSKPCNGLLNALQKAVTALEHSPEIPDDYDKIRGLECNVCHWRTLRKDAVLCDKCGSHDLGFVYRAEASDIGRVTP